MAYISNYTQNIKKALIDSENLNPPFSDGLINVDFKNEEFGPF